jgi:hypothetical protein
MGTEANVPRIIAIEGIKLAKRWIFPFITPRKPTVLEMDLMQVARLQSGPKAVDPAMVYIIIVLVSRPTDLVEFTKDQPTNPQRRL